jgi:ATP-dependent DNA helicase RecG
MNSNLPLIPPNESDQVEFKTTFNDEAIVSLVAFSNTKGGSVYIGVTDKGEVKGLQTGAETIQGWINEVKNKTNPSLIPDVELMSYRDKTVAVLSIDEYPIKPVSIKGRHYKRVANSNHLMSIDELANEHLKTLNSSWDYYLDPNHSMQSISLDKVKRFIRNVEQQKQGALEMEPIQFLEKMEIVRNNHLTFGGYLMFANDYCSISDVQVGRFKSPTLIIDSISLNSDLFSEIDQITSFIRKHLMVEIIITGEPMHTERFDYPLDAIREVVQNMVLHRDYRDSSASLIKIFDDRIEFFNPGALYGGITIENLLTGNYSSKTRNKLIAKAFKASGLIEQYGSGIMRIRRICKDYGLKDPLFQEMQQGFKVTLFKATIKPTDYMKVGDKVGDRVGDRVGVDLSQNQKHILELIKANNRISATELAEKVQISKRKIEENLAKLKQKGLLKRVGPAKGGHWKIL